VTDLFTLGIELHEGIHDDTHSPFGEELGQRLLSEFPDTVEGANAFAALLTIFQVTQETLASRAHFRYVRLLSANETLARDELDTEQRANALRSIYLLGHIRLPAGQVVPAVDVSALDRWAQTHLDPVEALVHEGWTVEKATEQRRLHDYGYAVLREEGTESVNEQGASALYPTPSLDEMAEAFGYDDGARSAAVDHVREDVESMKMEAFLNQFGTAFPTVN